MKLTYEVTKEDIINFNIYHHENSETERKRRLREKVFLALWTLLVYFIFNFNNISYKSFAMFTPVFFIAAIIIYFINKYRFWLIKKQINSLLNEGNNDGLIGSKSIIIRDDILQLIDEKSTNHYVISKLNKVVEDEKYVFVYTNSISALVIPKTYLSDEDKDELIKIINDKITS